MHIILIVLVTVTVIGFGIAQLIAGFDGLQHYLGTIGAVIVLLLCSATRLTLPLVISSFLGAMVVWGWPWYCAALFAAPGLVLMVPGIALAVASMSRETYWRKKSK